MTHNLWSLRAEDLLVFNGECKLASIWLYSRDIQRAAKFYRDTLQMRQIEHGRISSFDGGGLRLSIHSAPESLESVPKGESFLVFYVRHGIEARVEELRTKGVDFLGGIEETPIGRTARFKDPDGHEIYLWEPPSRDSPKFTNVAGIVNHYEAILSRLEP